jgi:molecular chaperone HscB
MEQMELRESLEEAPSQPDPYAATAGLMQQVEQALQQRVARVALLFEQPDDAHLQLVREEIRKMQFLQKLRRDIESVEERLDS